MAKVELKQPIVDEIAALFDGAASAVIVDYRGLTVEQDTILRKQLREAGISYKVYKIRHLQLWMPIWKDLPLWLFPRRMQPLRLEFWLSLQRQQISWN